MRAGYAEAMAIQKLNQPLKNAGWPCAAAATILGKAWADPGQNLNCPSIAHIMPKIMVTALPSLITLRENQLSDGGWLFMHGVSQ